MLFGIGSRENACAQQIDAAALSACSPIVVER